MRILLFAVYGLVIISFLFNNILAQSEYMSIDLSTYATKTIEWKYTKINPGNYIVKEQEIPFHLSKLVQFDYDSGIQKFPVSSKVSQVYVFLNTDDARRYNYDQILGWITLEFEENDKITKEIKIGKNIRNYQTTPFDDKYEFKYRIVDSIEDSNTQPIFSQVSKNYCKEVNPERNDICVDYYEPESEIIDMLTISIPLTYVNKKLEHISLEGNPDVNTYGFVSALTIKVFDGTSTVDNWFSQSGETNTILVVIGFILVMIIMVIIIRVRSRRPVIMQERQHPHGSFSKEDGTFTT